MDIRERTVGAVVVLDITGRIVANDDSGLLKDKISSIVFQGRHDILLNLGEVSYIDSAGLGELVAAYTAVARAGGRVKLLNVTRRVHDLLVITKLATVFDLFENEADAIRSFASTLPT
jgi:anti-sigma B factor antagonist